MTVWVARENQLHRIILRKALIIYSWEHVLNPKSFDNWAVNRRQPSKDLKAGCLHDGKEVKIVAKFEKIALCQCKYMSGQYVNFGKILSLKNLAIRVLCLHEN